MLVTPYAVVVLVRIRGPKRRYEQEEIRAGSPWYEALCLVKTGTISTRTGTRTVVANSILYEYEQ
eukprot:scaffold350619_cov34-Prasinocladus_malaysianus.AAC.1